MPMLCMSLSFVKEEKNTVKMSLYSTQQGTLVIKENQVDFWEEGMVFGRQKNKRQKHSNDDPFQSYQISSGRSFDAVVHIQEIIRFPCSD